MTTGDRRFKSFVLHKIHFLGNRIMLQMNRIFLWFIVICILGGFIAGLVKLYIYVEAQGVQDQCPSVDGFDSITSTLFMCYFNQYATTLTITCANLFFPFIFSYIVQYEEYNPKTRLFVDIFRSIIIRLSGLLVMIISLLRKNR